MKALTLRIDDDTYTRMVAKSRQERRSVNGLIGVLVDRWLGDTVAEVPGLEPAPLGADAVAMEEVGADRVAIGIEEDAVLASDQGGRSAAAGTVEGLIEEAQAKHQRHRPSKLVSAPRAEDAGVPNCPVCATDLVEVEGRASMVCPRCAA